MNNMCKAVNTMFTTELSLVLSTKNKLVIFSKRKLVWEYCEYYKETIFFMVPVADDESNG